MFRAFRDGVGEEGPGASGRGWRWRRAGRFMKLGRVSFTLSYVAGFRFFFFLFFFSFFFLHFADTNNYELVSSRCSVRSACLAQLACFPATCFYIDNGDADADVDVEVDGRVDA